MPRAKPFVIGFDSEDDGNGNPLMFAFVSAHGQFTCESSEDALDYLLVKGAEMRRKGFYLEAWATNLEYDLVNMYGPERIKRVKLIFGKSNLVGAEWRRKNVKFRDTVRHIPISVAEWGEVLGLPKVEKDLFDRKRKPTKAELKRRCIRDAAITYRSGRYLHEFYGVFDVTPKMTLASTALTIWKTKYWKREIAPTEDWIIETARDAYYGGRTEPFAIGTHEKVQAIDAASMFPWAMVVEELPLPWGLYERIRANGVIHKHSICEASIRVSSVRVPLLPYRSHSGLSYPVGDWYGTYTGEELQYAASLGYEVRIKSGIRFLETCSPFDGYVADIFRRKSNTRGPLRMGYKYLLNALYGKFAQRGDKIEVVPLEEFLNLQDPPEDFRVWNGLAIYTREEPPPIWGNCVWPAFITSRARMRLHREMLRVIDAGGTPLYCDTDSVIFKLPEGLKAIPYPDKAKEPGEFESRGVYRRIHIAGKKEYGLEDHNGEWDYAVKGIPSGVRSDYLFTGRATYEKPIRVKESARRGIPANKWVPITKVRRVTYKNRALRSDRTLAPIVVGQLSENSHKAKGQENGTKER